MNSDTCHLHRTALSCAGQVLLAKTLMSADAPMTLVVTGPLTNLAWVLDHFPDAESKIKRLHLMGERSTRGRRTMEEGRPAISGARRWMTAWVSGK